MIVESARKVRQLAADPVLRRWLARRALGAAVAPPPFEAHRPPYLSGFAVPDAEKPAPPRPFRGLAAPPPDRPIRLPLPGLCLDLAPGGESGLYASTFADVETLLALHRFAWLPLVAEGAEKASWFAALWAEWRRRFARPDASWAWHPYTAAERAINILDFAGRHGLPEPVEDTVLLLARHAAAIHARLEYFGEHDTSNHLANNGRGLFRVGLALGLAPAAEAGAAILLNEAGRIFLPSGVLREGSSHYHLLLARTYADAWLAARRHRHGAEAALRAIAAKAFAVTPRLTLAGGLPLIGDVSPDCPPEFLAAGGGWSAALPDDERAALKTLIEAAAPPAPEALAGDGWLRLDAGPWSGLWHCPPAGWPPMPGHAHQDLGGCELHVDGVPVLVDPGRGRYGDSGEAALYRSGRVHNTLLVDGRDPYPPNKPYYDDAFRARVVPAPPRITATDDRVTVIHHGFRRLKGVGALERGWRLGARGVAVEDRLAGYGRRLIIRQVVTPFEAEEMPGGVLLKGAARKLWLSAGYAAKMSVKPVTLWRAYGQGRPGRLIEFVERASLPWSGRMTLEIS